MKKTICDICGLEVRIPPDVDPMGGRWSVVAQVGLMVAVQPATGKDFHVKCAAQAAIDALTARLPSLPDP